MNLPRIVEATARPEDYTLWVRFDDGLSGRIDLSDLVGEGVFAAWQDPDHFAAVQVDHGTVVWPEGIDLCPDVIYRELTEKPLPA